MQRKTYPSHDAVVAVYEAKEQAGKFVKDHERRRVFYKAGMPRGWYVMTARGGVMYVGLERPDLKPGDEVRLTIARAKGDDDDSGIARQVQADDVRGNGGAGRGGQVLAEDDRA